MNKESFKIGLFTIKHYLLLVCILCFIWLPVNAQTGSSDDLLKQALEATNGSENYPLAIKLAQEGLKISPDYADIRILLGRLYLLTGKNDQAIQELKTVLVKHPDDADALNYIISASYQNKDLNEAIKYSTQYLNHYPDDKEMMIKRIAMLRELKDFEEAYHLSKTLHSKYPENRKIRTINNELFLLTRQNQIGLGYSITAFDQSDKKPWNLFSASYMRTEKFGTLVGRVNYADRTESKGYQFEVEAYPIHGAGYSFINFSYANAVVFPRVRFSYSYFMPFGKSWETEVGIRYLKSDDDFLSFTGAIGKYFGSYWLNLKLFLTPNEGKVANSYTLAGRYYINDSQDDYFTAIAGYGFSPDDRGRNFEINSRLNMQSVRFTLGHQHTLWGRNILGAFGTWNNQKYETGNKRNEYEASVTFRHKF